MKEKCSYCILAMAFKNWYKELMCAQYLLTSWAAELAEKYNISIPVGTSPEHEVSFRSLPYSAAIVIVNQGGERQFQKMNFSLVPSWSTEAKVKFATHNARIETVLEKPSWRQSFLSRRCLVPLTEFVESIYENKYAGNMVKFSDINNRILTAAGIWDSWADPKTQKITQSFAILTQEPPDYIWQAGHDRCPIFLKDEAFDTWLDPNLKEGPQLLNFLKQNTDPIDFKTEIDRPLKPGWQKRR